MRRLQGTFLGGERGYLRTEKKERITLSGDINSVLLTPHAGDVPNQTGVGAKKSGTWCSQSEKAYRPINYCDRPGGCSEKTAWKVLGVTSREWSKEAAEPRVLGWNLHGIDRKGGGRTRTSAAAPIA